MYKRSKTKQINNGKSKLRKINYESVGGFNENINEMDLDDLNNIDDFEESSESDSSESDSDSEMYGGGSPAPTVTPTSTDPAPTAPAPTAPAPTSPAPAPAPTLNTTKWEEETRDDKKVITDDIEKYIPVNFKSATSAEVAKSLKDLSQAKNFFNIYNNKTNQLEHEFINIFNFFVQKQYNVAYESLPNSDITTIINNIGEETNNKVAVYKTKLPLYNIDNTIKNFRGVGKLGITSDEEFTTFIEEMLKKTSGTPSTKKTIKDYYSDFKVNDTDNPNSPYIPMFMPHLLEVKSNDSALRGGVRQYNNTNAKKDAIKGKKPNKYDGINWKTVSNTDVSTLYTIDKTFNDTGSKSVEATGIEVREYFKKCEDLQIFYINKHILIHRLMSKMVELIKYNIRMNKMIEKLTSPNEISIKGKSGEMIKLKGILKSINTYFTEDAKSLAMAKKLLSKDVTLEKKLQTNKDKLANDNIKPINKDNTVEIQMKGGANPPDDKNPTNIKTMTLTLKEKYYLMNEYFIILPVGSNSLNAVLFFGRIVNYTNDDNNKYSLTVEILYNPKPNNDTIPKNSNFVLVNYKSSDNLAYEINKGKVFNKVPTGDDTKTEFYLLDKEKYSVSNPIDTNPSSADAFVNSGNGNINPRTASDAGSPSNSIRPQRPSSDSSSGGAIILKGGANIDITLDKKPILLNNRNRIQFGTTTIKSGSGTLTEAGPQILTFEYKDNDIQEFNGQKKISDFGKNMFFAITPGTPGTPGTPDTLQEISFKVFKYILCKNGTDTQKDINGTEVKVTATTVGIKFGSRLEYFRDYNLLGKTPHQIYFNKDTKDNTKFLFTIQSVDYKNEMLRITPTPNTIAGAHDNIKESNFIKIPNFKRQKIIIPQSVIDGDLSAANDGDTILFTTVSGNSITATATATLNKKDNYFYNLNIDNDNNKLKELVASLNGGNNTFQVIKYAVDTIENYLTLVHIDTLQKHNMASLKSILGIENTENTMEKIIDEYQKNISKGSLLISHTNADDMDNLTKLPKEKWQNFNNNSTKGHYFQKTLTKLNSSKSISDKDEIQNVIYKCYDLQILYLMKHLEVIFINNVLFYYTDMLAKQVALFLFVLSLYKRHSVDLTQITSVDITDVFKDLSILTKGQTEVIDGKMSGGSGSNMPTSDQGTTDAAAVTGDATSAATKETPVTEVATAATTNAPAPEAAPATDAAPAPDAATTPATNATVNQEEPATNATAVTGDATVAAEVATTTVPTEEAPATTNTPTATQIPVAEQVAPPAPAPTPVKPVAKITPSQKLENLKKQYITMENTIKEELKKLINIITITIPDTKDEINEEIKAVNKIIKEINIQQGGKIPEEITSIKDDNDKKLEALRLYKQLLQIEKIKVVMSAENSNEDNIKKFLEKFDGKETGILTSLKGVTKFSEQGLLGILDSADFDNSISKEINPLTKQNDITNKQTTKLIKNQTTFKSTIQSKEEILTSLKVINNGEGSVKVNAEIVNSFTNIKKVFGTDDTKPDKIIALLDKNASAESYTPVRNFLSNSLTHIIPNYTIDDISKENKIKNVKLAAFLVENNNFKNLIDLRKKYNEKTQISNQEDQNTITDFLKKLEEINNSTTNSSSRGGMITQFGGNIEPVIQFFKVLQNKIPQSKEEKAAAEAADKVAAAKAAEEVAAKTAAEEAAKAAAAAAKAEAAAAEAKAAAEEQAQAHKKKYNDINNKGELITLLDTLYKKDENVQKEKITQIKGIDGLKDDDIEKCYNMIQFYKEVNDATKVILTPEQIKNIDFESGIATLTKLVKNKQAINEIIEKLSLAELKALDNYKKYITPLADIYGKISKGKADIEKTVLDRIETVNGIYAKSPKSPNSPDELFSGTTNKDNTLYKTLEFTFKLDKLIASNETLHNESVKTFINDLTEEKFIEANFDKANFDKVEFKELHFIKNLQDIYKFIIPNNIRTIYETVLGAAMVVLRIKPLRAHNTAPTYQAITTHFGEKKKNIDKFNVRDYIQMKNPDSEKVSGNGSGNGSVSVSGNVSGNGNENSSDLTEGVALQTKSFQDGGYKYNDIVGSVQGDKLEIKFGKICSDSSIIPDETDRNFTYGPFASIYTPEYNNFDIYRFLFGANKMGDAEEIEHADFQPKLSNIDTKLDLYPYTKDDYSLKNDLGQPINQSQDLIRQKLDKGGNIVLFGFGFSGSGKTYSLIEGNKYNATAEVKTTKYDPSILEQFIKDNNKFIDNVQFLDIYPYEKTYIPNKHNNDIMYDTIKKTDENANILFEVIQERLNKLEEHRRKHLRICATPNNDSSSRSFLQITINLTKGNKLVFFDMPGSENTVRLRTELLGHEVLKGFKPETEVNDHIYERKQFSPNPINFKKFFDCYNIKQGDKKEVNSRVHILKLKNTTETINPIELDKEISLIFKDCLIEKNKYTGIFKERPEIPEIPEIPITNELTDTKDIAKVAEELNLFLNGYTEETIIDYLKNANKIEKQPILKILDKTQIKQICLEFIRNVILKKDEDKPTEYKYFDLLDKSEKNYSYFEKNDFSNDQKQFENVFGYLKLPDTAEHFKDKILDLSIFEFKIEAGLSNKEIIEEEKKRYNFIRTNTKMKYFRYKNKKHPLIKYFIYILNILNITIYDERFYPALLIYIFKYIKFIVKQGEGIVTTLEHLKFFFLSNTFNIEDYNNNQDEANKKFIFKYDSKTNPLDNERSYTVTTEAFRYTDPEAPADTPAQIIELKEKINIGQMKNYKLLSVLQDLAGESNLEDSLGYKEVKDKDNKVLYRYLDLLSKPKITDGVKSLFIMFTNLKIFRDNEKYDNPDLTVDSKTNFDLVCGAAKDTLDFAQSISSTTQGKTETKAHGGSLLSKIKKSPKKFNMKELTKKHKKQNRIQTVKKQLKTNNKKTLYSRHSKKYQK